MHLVVDAVAAGPDSTAIVVGNLLRGWREAWPDDRITLLAGPDGLPFEAPAGVAVERLPRSLPGPLGGLWLRSVTVRAAARRLGADAVLSGVPATTLLGAPCPRGLILYDLRHELRPDQFSRAQRLARGVSWRWTMSRADGIYCISERTCNDLRARHPRLARHAMPTQLGSDHARQWRRSETGEKYALAFGHFANKNVPAVLEGWAAFSKAHPDWTLRLVGMGSRDRAAAQQSVEGLGIAESVTLMPWLDDHSFASCFASASMIVFPSDFEGFGLPAAEALRLGIPAVVSSDPALAEVTGGHAAVCRSVGADDLRAAMEEALSLTPAQLAAGREFAEGFTWASMASSIRGSLLAVRR
jgi:glycosyltransferase involved in cell wall biosynthesis